jgi:hypothetical protein
MVWKRKSAGLGSNDEARLGATLLWRHQKLIGLSEERVEEGERMGVGYVGEKEMIVSFCLSWNGR